MQEGAGHESHDVVVNVGFEMQTPCTVLLTATVRPANFAISTPGRTDVATRTADYIAALRFWGSLPDERIEAIVFCDNSGEDITPIIEAARGLQKPVEVLGFKDAPPPSNVHYGYGELGIIDHALRNSARLKRAGFILKCTGRLKFPRISTLLDALPDRMSGAIDHRRRYRDEAGPPTRARTQLMMFSPSLYADTLFERRGEMCGSCSHIEEYLAHKFEQARFTPPLLRRFPVECPPSGVGGNGNNYDSLREKCKSTARAMARRWLPNLWL